MASLTAETEAKAYVASQRAGGVAKMADRALVMLVMGGDAEPDFAACDAELSRRALDGNRFCIRACWGLLHKMWEAERISTGVFVDRSEGIARTAAADGDNIDARQLVITLAAKADWLRDKRGHSAAYDTEVEALKLLGTIANEAQDYAAIEQAAADFNELTKDFSAAALADVRGDLWIEAFCEQRLEPEVALAAARTAKEGD